MRYWHFAFDVDIRQRDEAYAKVQRAGIEALIKDLQTGQLPSGD